MRSQRLAYKVVEEYDARFLEERRKAISKFIKDFRKLQDLNIDIYVAETDCGEALAEESFIFKSSIGTID